METDIRATGYLTITLTDSETGLVRVINTPNKVVDLGLIYLAAKIISPYETRTIKSMRIGTSSQPVSSSDQDVVAEVAENNLGNLTASGGTISAFSTFGEGVGTASITELGLFLSDGTLLARTVIPVQTKSSTTSMDVVWTITLQPV
jgi:hypothetical protein